MRNLHFYKDRHRYYLFLVLTLAYYLVPWKSLPPAALVVGLPFLLLYTVVLPGAALGRLLPGGNPDVFEKVTLWFFRGLIVLLFCCFVWALSGLSAAAFKLSLPVVFALLIWWSDLKAKAGAAGEPPSSRNSRLPLVLMGLLLLALFILLLSAGAAVDYSKDSPDHIGYVNEIAETGKPFPTTAIYKDPGANGADLRKGLLHAVYGFYERYLGADAVDLFRGINAFWSLLLLLAVYTTANRLFRNRTVAVLSSVFFLLGFEEGIRNYFVRTTFFPNRIGLGFLLLFLSAALGYIERRERRLLAEASLYAFAAAAVHIQYVVLVAAAVLSIGFWKTCFPACSYRDHFLRFFYVGAAAFLGMLPYAVYRYFTAYQANELHQQIQGVVFLGKSLFVVDPTQIYASTGLIGVASVFCVLPLWKRRRDNPGLGYLIASTLTIIVTVFNPVFSPVLYKVITYLVFRLVFIWPFYMLAAYALVVLLSPAPQPRPQRVLDWVVLAVLLAAVLAVLLPVFKNNAFSPATLEKERRVSHLQWEDGLERLRTMLPPRSVIASDPVTSYTIDAFTSHYVLSTFDQHAPPNDLLVRERTIASRDILSPYNSAEDKARLIDKWGVTHVVVNGRLRGGITIDYWMTNEQSAPLIRRRLLAMPELFETVWDQGGFLILRCTGAEPTVAIPASVPVLVRELPPDVRLVGKPAGVVWLDAARLDESRPYEKGDTLRLSLYWSRREPLPLAKYAVTIRLDRTDNEERFGGAVFPKLARKLKERRTGELYRFRSDYKILNGFFDPDLWPEGCYVNDNASLKIPRNAAPGKYTVRATLLTAATIPNERLKDFFYDDDKYHGVEIGEVTIIPAGEPEK